MKAAIKRLLGVLGKEIRPLYAPTHSFARALDLLRVHIAPGSVIDVGVAGGTPELYRAFPGVAWLLVEANPVFQEALDTLTGQLGAAVETVFCGAEHSQTTFNVFSDPRKSSALQPVRNLRLERQITVPVEPLDALVAKHTLPAPFLLKIDVEGAELDVLRGASGTLAHTDALIVETSVMPRFEDGAEFAEVVRAMQQTGFVVFDIAAGVNHPHTGYLNHVDLFFVRADASFRRGAS